MLSAACPRGRKGGGARDFGAPAARRQRRRIEVVAADRKPNCSTINIGIFLDSVTFIKARSHLHTCVYWDGVHHVASMCSTAHSTSCCDEKYGRLAICTPT